jgi:CRISPR-associated protein (TIGR02584 family)
METKKYREILIFVAGTTPQIITETLYGLIVGKKPPMIPDEVYILTTESGKRRIQEELVHKGWLAGFQKEFGLAAIPFVEKNIVVLTDSRGQPLARLRGFNSLDKLFNFF